MVRILGLSSCVAHGHVGLSAMQPALQALGHTVTGLPTAILSNHTGWAHSAGQRVAPKLLRDMVRALSGNGWLHTQDVLLTGYLPTQTHVAVACDLADQTGARVVVDPVLGDDPDGLYLPQSVGRAIRRDLLPRADVLTPNRFELSWLSGRPCDTLEQTLAAARNLLDRVPAVLVTSPPIDPFDTGILAVAAEGARLFRTEHHADIPKGTGDVFAALTAAGLTPGAALGHLQALAQESRGAEHLRIAEAAAIWTTAAPVRGKEVPWPSISS